MQLFSHDAKADALAKAPLFRNLSRSDLVALAKVTEDLEVDEGKVLAREGEIGHEFFVIVDGDVEVAKDGQPVRKLGPGDFFGEIALIWDSPRRTATVTAASPRTALRPHPPGLPRPHRSPSRHRGKGARGARGSRAHDRIG